MLYMLYKHYIDPSSDVAVAVALGYDQHNILKEVNSLNDIKDELRSRLGDYVSHGWFLLPLLCGFYLRCNK